VHLSCHFVLPYSMFYKDELIMVKISKHVVIKIK